MEDNVKELRTGEDKIQAAVISPADRLNAAVEELLQAATGMNLSLAIIGPLGIVKCRGDLFQLHYGCQMSMTAVDKAISKLKGGL